MGNFKTSDDESNSFTIESVLEAPRDFMSPREKVIGERHGEIGPSVDFIDWAQQNMSVSYRIDGQEAGAEFVAIHECSGYVTCEYA